MSLFFDGASGVWAGIFGRSSPVNLIVSYPFTISCWFFPTNSTINQQLVILKNNTTGDGYYLGLRGDATGDPIYASTWNGSIATSAEIQNAIRFNQWNHAAARFVSDTSRTVQINGGTGTSNTADSQQTSQLINTVIIGQGDFASRYFNGYIAHVAIWNEPILNADNATLGRGASPLYIRRQNLVAYWPMVNPGQQINIADGKSRVGQPLPLMPNPQATTSAPKYSNWNPPVKTVLPTERKIVLESPAAQNNAPIFYHQRQQQGMAA